MQPVPPADDAAAFARSLNDAAAIVRNRDSSTAAVRKAAQSQQLAVRTLADSSRAFRRKVIAALDPETAVVIRGAVDAARSLARIHVPAPAKPPWHIVAPTPPAELLSYYHEAQRRTGVNWSYLAAIQLVETRMGRIRGDSPFGARGPMQFVRSTWQLYGAGGDINNPRDAILAAARLLRANGAPADMRNALLHYNPTEAYVRAITDYARTMRQSKSAYLGYWNWRVIYSHGRATYVLPVGYPKRPAIPLESRPGR